MDKDNNKERDLKFFDDANMADLITVVGELEHLYMHCCKAAAVSEKEEDVLYYMTMADMTKAFRRNFMKRHFPFVDDRDWCIIKAADSIRQRVFESCHTRHEDLEDANNLWAELMQHIFGIDMSGCASCAKDREETKETPQE